MTTAKIKINIGNITVEIEAPVDKIEEAVKNTIAAIRSTEQATPQPQTQTRKPVTCKKAVEDLLADGWLQTGRTLAEVVSELERRGFLYDTTAVAHVLLDLVREGKLERVGEPRRYIYLAKKTSVTQRLEENSTR
ncbi:conserved hypothetical protein [Candidatus Caldarchaeum subterraneum]|uniref:Uncharacterized protein n=1 Tax=Caldiarchaeum subterraneum TaxID=311458 RepID=E6N8P7_CALS0|nr:conserved hypothetical protein [Candidatus Caldarchaeum subterraneum]BAJ51371.1 conserved hypothetical protein [Candidatus Caldarchaeum subterraneum]